MAMTTDASLRHFISGLFFGTSINVKTKQIQALDSILRGKDTLCILPTGFGKSLIYQMIPAAFSKMHNVEKPIVVILSPLLSLISDQVKSSKTLPESLGVKAAALDLKIYSQISSGDYNLLFGTPESFLNVTKWRDMLASEYFAEKTVCIVVDEVHKVRWGQSETSKPFREAFRRINELHSII